MPRESLGRKLQSLMDQVLVLGSMVENALTESVEGLKRKDMEASRRLIAHDRLINERRFEVEADALALIATQQPTARDLRTIAAALDIASELERMGDYAKGIARINVMIGTQPFIKPLWLISPPWRPERERCCTNRWRPSVEETWTWPGPSPRKTTRWMPCTTRSIESCSR